MSQPDTRELVGNAISAALREADEMVTKWLACVETVDADGVRALWLLSNEEAKAWDNLGMLTYALQREQARTVHESDEED